MSFEHYTIDHIGIAVPDLEAAIADYKRNFGFEVELREEVPEQKVSLVFLASSPLSIELITPRAPDATLQRFLDTRGPGLHHICYKVKNIREELARLEGLGHTLIDRTPRHGARHTLIAFLHPKTTGGVLTELCEYTMKS